MATKNLKQWEVRDAWEGNDRDLVLNTIYQSTHKDYKGKADGAIWGEAHHGKKSIVVFRNGGSCLSLLEDLSDSDINERINGVNLYLRRKHEADSNKAGGAL